jgi:hypothetical protein
MHKSEVEASIMPNIEILQRLKVGRVLSIPGNREVQPVDRSLEATGNPVCQINQQACVLRFDEVSMVEIAVAEMETQRNLDRDVGTDAFKPVEDAFLDRGEMRLEEGLLETAPIEL